MREFYDAYYLVQIDYKTKAFLIRCDKNYDFAVESQDDRLSVDFWNLCNCNSALVDRPVETWTESEVATLEAAIQSRNGSFLEQMTGEWVTYAQQMCAEAYQFGLECLIRYHRHRGQLERSISAAQNLVGQDPYREDFHNTLIELYTAQGRHTDAAKQYETCANLLLRDLGTTPSQTLSTNLVNVRGGRQELATRDIVELISDIDQSMHVLRRKVLELQLLLDEPGRPSRSRIVDFR